MADTVKIVLSGYYGFDNIGDEAVLYAIVKAIREQIKDVSITVLSNNPEKTKSLYGVESVNRWQLKEVAKVIKESDLLVSGGGSLLQDVTSSKTIPYYLAIVKIAQFYKKKVVFYSQGIGPVDKSTSRWLIKKVVNKVDGIFVRDPKSKALLEEIGVKKPVSVAIDPVLGLGKGEVEDSSKKVPPTVGIYIRPWQDEAHDKNMLDSMTEGLTDLLAKGYNLCFIPMHYEQDREIAKKLAKEVEDMALNKQIIAKTEVNRIEVNRIEVIDKNLTIKEVLAYTASFEFVIGMRLHSLIMAAATYVPMLGLSYDPKVTAFIQEVQVPYCINTNELTKENFNEQLKKLEENKIEQKANLQKVLEEKQERIYLPTLCIKTLLGK